MCVWAGIIPDHSPTLRREQADGFDFRGDETAASEGKTTERRSRRVSAVMKTEAEEAFAEVFCFVLEKKKKYSEHAHARVCLHRNP